MNKEENMEIRTLETFVKGVKEEGGTFIENHGRAGNSCIYNKEQK